MNFKVNHRTLRKDVERILSERLEFVDAHIEMLSKTQNNNWSGKQKRALDDTSR